MGYTIHRKSMLEDKEPIAAVDLIYQLSPEAAAYADNYADVLTRREAVWRWLGKQTTRDTKEREQTADP